MAQRNKKAELDDTGERMVPEYSKGSLMYAEHFIRYQTALHFVENKVVLDIACGSGYGTKMLAAKATKVYGVDNVWDAINYANTQFGDKNIEFIQGEATKIPLNDNTVDVVVTFETIEHIRNYRLFMKEVDRVLKKDGILLVSTPNNLEFRKGNHFHLHEFEHQELLEVIRPHFKYIDSYYQGTWKYTAIGSEDFVSENSSLNVFTSNLAPLNKKQYLYFYLVCSRDRVKVDISPIAGIGEHYSDKDVINAWSASNAHQERLQREAQEHIYVLNQEINKLIQETENAHKELANIYTSKTYKFAKSISYVKNRTTKRRS